MSPVMSRRTSMLVVTCAVLLACVIVPAAVFAVVDGGGGVNVAGAPQPVVTATSNPVAALSGTWANDNVTITIVATATSPATASAAYSFTGLSDSYVVADSETTEAVITSSRVVWVGRTVSDAPGVVSGVTSYTINIDKTAPGIPSLTSVVSGWNTQSVIITPTASDTGGSGIKDYRWTYTRNGVSQTTTYTPSSLSFSADGTYSVTVAARDIALNTGAASVAASFSVDSNAPTTTANSTVDLAKWQSKPTGLTLSSTDPAGGSGVKNIWWIKTLATGESSLITTYVAGNIQPFETEGVNTIRYWAKDVAGNVEATKTAYVRIDLTKPVTSSNATTTYNGLARITLTANDALSGIEKTMYSVDGKPTATGASVVVTTSVTATHTVAFSSVDKAGNSETTKTISFLINADSTPPVTAASGGTGVDLTRWQSRDVTLTLVATDTPRGSGVVATYCKVGTSAATAYVAPFRISTEGTTSVDFWSVDDVGNKEATKTVVISIDKTKPISSLITTATSFSETASLSVVATDKPSGVAKVVSWVDTGTASVLINNASGVATQTVVIPCSIAGTHTINYVVSDMAGNDEATRSVTVHVTRTPTVTLSTKSATLKNTSSPAKTTIAGTLADGTLGLAGKRVTLWYSSASSLTGAKSLTTTTTVGGKFSFSVSLADKTFYAVKFDGDADFYQAQGATISLLPRVYISTPKAGTSQHASVTFYVTGTLKPAHSKSSYLYIKRYKYSSTKHAYVYNSKVRATITAKTGYSSYKSGQQLARGTWRLIAYMATDSKHAATSSAYLKVAVR